MKKPTILQICVVAIMTTCLRADDSRNSIRAIAFSNDGKSLAAVAASGKEVGELAVWDVETWKIRFVKKEGVGFPRVAFSPDGKTIGLARYGREAHLLNAATGDKTGELKGHTDHVRSIAFTPDGKQIVTGSYDKSLKIWNASTKELLHTIEDVATRVGHIDVSADGKWIAIADSQGYAFRVFDSQSHKKKFESKRLKSLVSHVAFSPDGQRLGVACWVDVDNVYDVPKNNVALKLDVGYSDWVTFSHDGKIAFASSRKAIVFAFPPANTNTKARVAGLIGQFRSDDYETREAASDELKQIGGAAEPQLAACNNDPNPEVRLRTRRIREYLLSRDAAVILQGESDVECVEFSPDGMLLVCGEKSGRITVWRVSDWKKIREFSIPESWSRILS